jgi:hypothetical protein
MAVGERIERVGLHSGQATTTMEPVAVLERLGS